MQSKQEFFACPICNWSSTRKSSYSRHLQTHNTVKPDPTKQLKLGVDIQKPEELVKENNVNAGNINVNAEIIEIDKIQLVSSTTQSNKEEVGLENNLLNNKTVTIEDIHAILLYLMRSNKKLEERNTEILRKLDVILTHTDIKAGLLTEEQLKIINYNIKNKQVGFTLEIDK